MQMLHFLCLMERGFAPRLAISVSSRETAPPDLRVLVFLPLHLSSFQRNPNSVAPCLPTVHQVAAAGLFPFLQPGCCPPLALFGPKQEPGPITVEQPPSVWCSPDVARLQLPPSLNIGYVAEGYGERRVPRPHAGEGWSLAPRSPFLYFQGTVDTLE